MMNSRPSLIEGVIEGRNSVLLETSSQTVFYEKLSNTIHLGETSDVSRLQKKVEKIHYEPEFESETLRRGKNRNIEGLLLGVTEACNLRCSYCIYSGDYEGEREHGSKKMDFETAKKAIDIYIPQSLPVSMISFYGGEPTLNMPLIREIIRYCKTEHPNKRVLYSMTSNFFDVEDIISELVADSFNIMVSLDGPAEVHDRYRLTRDRNPTWERVVRNISLFRENYNPSSIRHISASVTCADKSLLENLLNFSGIEMEIFL